MLGTLAMCARYLLHQRWAAAAGWGEGGDYLQLSTNLKHGFRALQRGDESAQVVFRSPWLGPMRGRAMPQRSRICTATEGRATAPLVPFLGLVLLSKKRTLTKRQSSAQSSELDTERLLYLNLNLNLLYSMFLVL